MLTHEKRGVAFLAPEQTHEKFNSLGCIDAAFLFHSHYTSQQYTQPRKLSSININKKTKSNGMSRIVTQVGNISDIAGMVGPFSNIYASNITRKRVSISCINQSPVGVCTGALAIKRGRCCHKPLSELASLQAVAMSQLENLAHKSSL